MGALDFAPATVKVTRDGRQYLKDTEFCESVKSALKATYDDKTETHLSAKVIGKAELRKLRGALRHFADAQGWGLSLRTDGDESATAPDKTEYTVTFRAQPKREAPAATKPRRVRRRKDETEDAYLARVREKFPKGKNEKPEAYAARLAEVTSVK